MKFNQCIASARERSRKMVLWVLLGTLAGCTPQRPPAPVGINSFQFPMCARVGPGSESLDPPFAHSAHWVVPAKDVRSTQPATVALLEKNPDTKVNKFVSRPDLGISDLSMVIRDLGKKPPISKGPEFDDVVRVSSAPGALNVASSFTSRTWDSGPDSYEFIGGVLKMKKNLEIPLLKKSAPENGFWVYERPETWISHEGKPRSNTLSWFPRVFVPVGYEQQVVIDCNYGIRAPHAGHCEVITLLPLPQVPNCGGAHLRYQLFSEDMPKWREIDARLRQRINSFIADSSKHFGDLVPDLPSTK